MRCFVSVLAISFAGLCLSASAQEKAIPFEPWKAEPTYIAGKPTHEYFKSLNGKLVRIEGLVTGLRVLDADKRFIHPVTSYYLIHKKGSDQKPEEVQVEVGVRFAEKDANSKQYPILAPVVVEGRFSYHSFGGGVGTRKLLDARVVSLQMPITRKALTDRVHKQGIKYEY